MADLIERQVAIDALAIGEELLKRVLDDMDVVGNEREKYEWGLGLIESYIADMKDLPSAQPEPQWIPCSETENLPEHEVLCCDRYGEELIGWLLYEDDQWLCESEGEMMYDPIAWREKPEPWRGEK